jgi:hypothetical protein
VKEDILSRFGELGVFVKEGKLHFEPKLLRRSEFLKAEKSVDFMAVSSKKQTLKLDQKSLGFTYCQVPVIYKISENEGLEIIFSNGNTEKFSATKIDAETSRKIFERTGEIEIINVYLDHNTLLN